MENLNKDQFNTTCALTGRKDNLKMYAHRNANGNMIGWLFLHEDIRPSDVGLKIVIDDMRPVNHAKPPFQDPARDKHSYF